ncbi:MAG: retroviral-like aspartic protease family protein [Candidatus Eremiobacteraeota bacterium]|nr:retroviral-like aspartic protease family protein [Candidatus Eremiobacteraeota bacterium]
MKHLRLRAAALALGLCVGPLLAGMAQSAQLAPHTAPELLALHRAFTGWSFQEGTVQNVRLTGTDGGLALTEVRSRAGFRRTRTTSGGLALSNGFDGTHFWQTDINGIRVDAGAARARLERAVFDVLNERFESSKTRFGSAAAFEGSRFESVRIEPSETPPIDLVIDPQSGKLLAAIIDPDGASFKIRNIQYADVGGGKKVIRAWTDNSNTYSFSTVRINEGVEAAALRPPPETLSYREAGENGSSFVVRPTGIYVVGSFNGVKGTFKVDSGATCVLLSAAFAKRAHLTGGVSTRVGTFGDDLSAMITSADVVELPAVHIEHLGVFVAPDALDADGVVGFPYLSLVRLEVNSAQDRVSARLARKTAMQGNVDFYGFVPKVDVTLPWSGARISVVVDTGAENAVYLPVQFLRVGLEARIEGNAVGKKISGLPCATMNDVRLGITTIDSGKACFFNTPLMGNALLGILGYEVLRSTPFVLDYANNEFSVLR